MFSYSPKALGVRPRFFSSFSEVEIFVEDKTISSEVFYSQLFDRLLMEKELKYKVFSLGGKDEVVRKCRQYNSSSQPNKNKSLFIVDGDIDLIIDDNREIRAIPNLFVLDAYCIENYLVDEQAALHVIFEESGTRKISSIQRELSFNIFISSHINLMEVHFYYAISQKYGLGLSHITKGSVSNVVKGCSFFDSEKCKNEKNRLEQNLKIEFYKVESAKFKLIVNNLLGINLRRLTQKRREAYTDLIISTEMQNLTLSWKKNSRNVLKVVSGKDYLLPLLRDKMSSIVKQKSGKEAFKLRMARNCSLGKLFALAQTLQSLV